LSVPCKKQYAHLRKQVLGMVITSGIISEEAAATADKYYEDKGIRIELIDGEQFAKLIIEKGIRTT
jgi:hypothetical protein